MSLTRNITLMRRFAPIEMRELTDRHRPKRLIAIGEMRKKAHTRRMHRVSGPPKGSH